MNQNPGLMLRSSLRSLILLSLICSWNLQLWAQPGRLDLSFDPGTGFDGPVKTMTIQPDGRILVGGSFASFNGTPCNNITRLNPNGSLDPTFFPGSAFNDAVNVMLVQPDGKVIVGGDFTTFNGIGRNGIARLLPNGMLDASFNPGSGATGYYSGAGNVRCLALQPNGYVLVGGAFQSFNGAFSNKIVRLRVNGSRDNTFNAGIGVPGAVFGGDIYAMALLANGDIYIGGSIDHHDLNEQCPGHLARLNANGSLDIGFHPELFQYDHDIHAIVMLPDGSFLLAVDYLTLQGRAVALRSDGKWLRGGRYPAAAGTGRFCISRYLANGSVDMGFDPGTGCTGGDGTIVNTIALLPDGRTMIGGVFTAFDGIPRTNIARLLDANCVVGAPCDDADPNSTNEIFQSDCSCSGGTPCTAGLELEITTDAQGAETTWEVLRQGTTIVVASGGPLAPNEHLTADICLSSGCYELRVMDAAGDGMTSGSIGGYTLRDQHGSRIIDNLNNFTAGSVSTIANNGGFCLPLGADRPLVAHCDKLDWVNNRFIVATENAAVSAQMGLTNTSSGYEFWFFDPNGGFSYRRFRSHATSDGFGSGATRACHFKINGWIDHPLTPHLPTTTLMNVRIRGRIAGTDLPFGPSCRFMIDPARAACPLTQLLHAVGDQRSSCGATRNYGNGNYVYAQPPQFNPAVAPSLLRYQFRFRNTALGFETVRQSNTYILPLDWTGPSALQCGTTYTVDVRVSKDAGATWCIDTPTPSQPYSPWGPVCSLTIAPCTGNDLLATGSVARVVSLTLYPNPNRGDQLFLALNEVAPEVDNVSVDIIDMTGKRVSARTIAVQDGFVNTTMELNGDLADGLYLVHVTAGHQTYTERLVIRP